MLLLLKTSSRKKSSKHSRKHSSKHKSKKYNSTKHYKQHYKLGKQKKMPYGKHSYDGHQPMPVGSFPVAAFAPAPPMAPPMAFGRPLGHNNPVKRHSSKRNLKGDLEKVLQKVKKVQSNKKVMKYKQRLDKCMANASCDVNDKQCIKTHCNKELKKYTKRFNKEYKKME
jgi:hypothetical protein